MVADAHHQRHHGAQRKQADRQSEVLAVRLIHGAVAQQSAKTNNPNVGRFCSAEGPPWVEADSLIICMAERRVRGIRSQGCAKRTAYGGDRFAIVLEFEFLSRIIASMQSMSGCRHKRRVNMFESERHDPEVEKARREIAEAAHAMMGGALSFIEGARRMHRLSFVGKLDWDPDIVPFIGIYSDTDALPVGPERINWAEDALERLQPEINTAERRAREVGRKHCQRLIDRFGGAQIS
jgi:hypothetical protein